ncbi:MAG: MBL fold metallo-hydrolase [Chitinophagaceae bacterium]
MQIFPLSEGVFTIGHDKIFNPFDPLKDVLTDRPTGSLMVEIQPFLIELRGEYILLDTGLGFKNKEGEWQLYENLKQVGVSPEQIHKVILSHLHKDHAGGILNQNIQQIESLMFPQATYYISKKEFEFAIQKGYPSYELSDFEMLKNHPQVEWLDEKGAIGDYISYETIGGHCPYHIAIHIKYNGKTVFYGGDVVPQLRQLKTKYVAKYDFDGVKSMELRQQFAKRGKEEAWTFLFYHDVKIPISTLA